MESNSYVIHITDPRRKSEKTIIWLPELSLSRVQLWALKLIKALLFLHSYDYVGLYKLANKEELFSSCRETFCLDNDDHTGGSSGSREEPKAKKIKLKYYRLLSGEKIKSELLKAHRKNANYYYWRDKVTCFLSVYLRYMVVKFSITAMLTCIFYSYDKYARERKFNQRSAEPTLVWSFLKAVDSFLGNPLYPLGDLAMLAYFLVSILNYLNIVILPKYRKTPIDLAAIRFLYNPMLEVNRIDTLIERKIDELNSSISYFEDLKFKGAFFEQKDQSSKHNTGCLKFKRRLANSIERQRKKLDALKSNFGELLRPINFSPEYHRWMQNLLEPLFYMILCASFWLSVIIGTLIYWSYEGKCKMKAIEFSKCRVEEVFTGREYLYGFEVLIATIVISLTSVLNCSLLILSCQNQNKIIEGLDKDLRMSINYLGHYRKLLSQKGQESPELILYGDQLNEDLTETVIMVALIKLLVCKDELTFGNQTLTHLIKFFLLFGMFFSMIVILFRDMVYDTDSKIYYYIHSWNNFILWLPINVMCLVCARVHSKFESLEPLCFSIIAQFASTNCSDNNQHLENIVLTLFRRLTYSSNFITQIDSIRPFNMLLSYRPIISLNFLIISLYSLTRVWFNG